MSLKHFISARNDDCSINFEFIMSTRARAEKNTFLLNRCVLILNIILRKKNILIIRFFDFNPY